MAATMNPLPEPVLSGKDPDKEAASDSGSITLFHRRIEFHAARKPFSGFSESGNSGFKLVTLTPNPNLSSKSEPQKAWSGPGKTTEHNSNGLDPKLSVRITFRRIGAGLQNLGNTCFLNSVLQCLTYTEPLAAYLQSGRHKISCRMAGFCALCAIQNHVSRALESTGRILAPKDLVSNLRCISRSFRNARQEDAHEYMVNLLESMHKCCLPSGVPSESPGAYEKSFVHKIFGGRLRSQVKCMQCSFGSNKFDPFLDLSLEIVKADSLYKALAHFTAQEQLDGGERQYQCQQCKQKVRALKHLTVYKAPEVLSIHLKRFGSHIPSQKIDKKIEFGATLDLKPFVTGPYDGDLKYTLYGVLVHAGWSTHSGHYYCFVRTSSGMWYSLDDNQVLQVSERRVLEQKAYMLFYVRDRTFSTSKKATDAVHKESMVINSSSRKVYSNYNQGLKENTPNGTAEKKLNGPVSAEAAYKQALNHHILKEVHVKVDSHQVGNGPMSPKSPFPNKYHAVENSLKMSPSVGLVNGFPVSNLNGGDCNGIAEKKLNGSLSAEASLKQALNPLMSKDSEMKVDSHLHGNAPNKDYPIENSLKVPPAVRLDNGFISNLNGGDCSVSSLAVSDGSVNLVSSTNEGSTSHNGLTVPVIMQHDCDGVHSTAIAKNGASVLTPTTDYSKAGAIKNLGNGVDLSSNMDGLLASPQDTYTLEENNAEKVGGFSGTTGLVDLSVRKADDVKDKECLSRTSKGVLRKKALDGRLHAVKRKPLKHFVTTRKLSQKIIFGVAFGPIKKKHRRMKKKCRSERYYSAKLDENHVQSDPGSCTSEKSKILPVHCVGHSQKRVKCGSDEKYKVLDSRSIAERDDLQQGGKGVTLRDASGQNKSINRGEILKMSSSVTLGEKPINAGKSCHSEHCKRVLMENGLMNMLTETTVACWDGVEHPGFVESRREESLRIGYVGDELDEAYDSGKRKKIRSSKIMSDGPNPFQEVAMKKIKAKKAKLDRYSSANQPFRIL